MVDQTLALVGQAAVPLSLIALGMGLAEYGAREGWHQSMTICALKLAVQPIVVFLLARALALPPLERRVVVMLASLPVGANVYLMSRQFGVLEGPIASSLVISTALAAAKRTPTNWFTASVAGIQEKPEWSMTPSLTSGAE
jgi:hypothetical protein